jgi:ribose/xylose/arabinose/galactoside ABC-type transport system permease subunit
MRQTALNLPDAAGGSAGSFQHLSRNALAIFLALALVIGGVVSPTFLSKGNISNLVLQWSPLAIVAIGQTLVIVVRGLDLSVASVMATAAVIATSFHGADSDIPAVVGLSMLISLAVGLLNGVLVTKRSVSPFLATLATMILLQGFRFAYTQGAPSGHVPPLFRVLGSGNLHGVPYNFMILVVIAAAFHVLLARSAFGRRVYIVGGNPVAATLVGINADRVTIAAYVISSLLACAAGLILSGYVGLVDNRVGQGFELDSIVAAVIGGVALSGGRGTLVGALVGAAVIVVIGNEVLMFGLPVQLQLIVKGLVIVLAAALYARRAN